MKNTVIAKKDRILKAMLAEVPFDGWTAAAYGRALDQAKVSRGEADLILPQGIRDVIDLFGVMADSAMMTVIEETPGFNRMRVRDKVTLGVRARLEALTPYREAVRRMMYWYAMPMHLPLGIRRLYRTVDLVWRAAGDTATDFNFYTKRALLAGVIKATVFFWLDDSSEACADSWAFLDRRIAEVLKLGKTIALAREWKPDEIMSFIRTRFKRP